jgi:hypothetical protein
MLLRLLQKKFQACGLLCLCWQPMRLLHGLGGGLPAWLLVLVLLLLLLLLVVVLVLHLHLLHLLGNLRLSQLLLQLLPQEVERRFLPLLAVQRRHVLPLLLHHVHRQSLVPACTHTRARTRAPSFSQERGVCGWVGAARSAWAPLSGPAGPRRARARRLTRSAPLLQLLLQLLQQRLPLRLGVVRSVLWRLQRRELARGGLVTEAVLRPAQLRPRTLLQLPAVARQRPMSRLRGPGRAPAGEKRIEGIHSIHSYLVRQVGHAILGVRAYVLRLICWLARSFWTPPSAVS